MTLDLPLPAHVEATLEAVRRAGGRPLVVGGAVRDAAAGLTPKDVDVEAFDVGVDALIDALESVGRVNAVGRSFGVLKVAPVEGVEIDVALPRRESKRGRGHRGFVVTPDPSMSFADAASRRDFTVNAMGWDPATRELLDPWGGRADLEARVLRHVGPRFADDPLRVLRGVQMAGRFGLRAAPETVALSRTLYAEYDTLAVERVWDEWRKWAAKSTTPSLGLAFLRDCGWWRATPPLPALAACPQDPEWHPEGDVWTHTLLVCDAAATIAARDGLDARDRTTLLLAALCHDLGKPATTFTDDDGRVRSPGHADRLEDVTAFLDAIGCPRRIADRVRVLTRHHLAHMSFAGSARHVRRLARSLGEGGETIRMLARVVEADHSGRPPLPGGLPEPMGAMLEAAAGLAAAEAAPRPILMGRHLLELGVAPGPDMGRLLGAAFDAQLDGEFDDLDGALAWARERVDRR